MTVNSEYAAYPTDSTYAMQQAWRLYFDEKSLKRGDSYQIKKNHPIECHTMFRRALVADGILRESDLNEEQIGHIEKKFVDLLDLAYENPRISFTASCLFLTGTASFAVFFCQYIYRQVC